MLPSSSTRAIILGGILFLTVYNSLHEAKSEDTLTLQQQQRRSEIFNVSDQLESVYPPEHKHANVGGEPVEYLLVSENVILCLARTRNVNGAISTSLYISKDYGAVFTDISENLVANIASKGKITPYLHKFINNPKQNGQFALSDVKNKLIYTTSDFGDSFNVTVVPFTPDQILFGPSPSSYGGLLALDESAEQRKLWASEDFGVTWQHVQSNVKSVQVQVGNQQSPSGPSPVYIEVYDDGKGPNNATATKTLLSSESMFLKNDTVELETGIDQFEMKEKYMFVTKKGQNPNSTELYISYNRGPFRPHTFPTVPSASKNTPAPAGLTVNDEPEFLIVAKRDAILKIGLSGCNRTRVDILPLGSGMVGSVMALDYDNAGTALYWSDWNKGSIKRQILDGKPESEPEIMVSTGIKSVQGLAFDWIAKNLYFIDCCFQNAKIEVIRTDRGRMRKKILGSEYLDKPRGIAVHPERGYLFWADWSHQDPYIGRSGLDGSNPEKIVTNSGRQSPVIRWPNSVVVDMKEDRLYWYDARLDYLVSSNLNGNKLQVYPNKNPTESHPFAFAIYNDYIYWDDWITKSISKVRKDGLNFTSNKIITVQEKLDRPMDMKVIGPSSQTGTNPCSSTEHSCEYFCLFKPNSTASLCACPDGLIPSGNGTHFKCLCLNGRLPKSEECENA